MNKLSFLNKQRELLLHLTFWIVVVAVVILQNQPSTFSGDEFSGEELEEMRLMEMYASHEAIWNLVFLAFFKIVFFYVTVFLIFPRYKEADSKWKIILPLLVCFGWCFTAEVLIFYLVEYDILRLNTNDEYSFNFQYEIINNGLLPFVAVFILAFGYWASKQWLRQKEGLEKLDVTVAELALLKNQVNPHFLFNTLNNLFSMAIEKNADELAQSIAQLTHLMRYSIYESNTPFIELYREVEYIENYIKLQKLRFTGDEPITIKFEVDGDLQHVRISPMLLINFVENAFKHGISLKQESFILIELRTTENNLYFTVENSIYRQNTTSSVKHAGFGLEHVKKLLQLQYPDRHMLTITEQDNVYKSELRLDLQKTKVEITALQ